MNPIITKYKKYNIKGIYGINGSGKSGIVTSVGILKNLLINPGYLSNPVVQKSLDSIINKKTGELFIHVEFIALSGKEPVLFHYQIALVKNITRKYIINYEQLSSRRASSKDPFMKIIFEIANGEIVKKLIKLYAYLKEMVQGDIVWDFN